MADKHLIDVQRDALIADVLHYDPTDDMCTMVRTQDVEPILELNKAQRKEAPRRAPDGMVHLGRIPAVIADDLHRKGILQDSQRLRRWILDPDNAAFLVRDPIDPKRD
jgi:hypothetical protein